MANTLVSFSKNYQSILGLTNAIIRQSGIIVIKPFGVRHLYSATTLGLDGYIQQKERTKFQLSNISERFREKMLEYTSDNAKGMVFTEDLKNMLHLAEGEDDIKLIIKMMTRFNQQNKQLRFGSFIFGPVVMRMFHFLNKPQEAYECFRNADLDGLFDQLMSYQLLLDLLYENQKYEQILETFELIKNKQIEGIKYAKNVIVIVFATCFKMNTTDSMKYALKLWSELNDVGHFPMRRAITFCAATAVNQGRPDAALEILSMSRNVNYTTIRNLKAVALVKIGRIEEAVTILKSIITPDTAISGPVQTFNRDVIDVVKLAVEELRKSDVTVEFNRILKYFQEQGHIIEMTLEEQLCQEISTPPVIGKRVNENFRQQPQFSQFNRDTANNGNSYKNRTINRARLRPGLTDLQ